MNDLMMLRGMDQKEGLSPYEQVKLDHMAAKNHTGGVAVAGLVTGVAGVTLQNSTTQRQLDQLTQLFAAERAERINGDQTITQTVNDTVSGSQQSSLTAQQAAELSAVNSVMTQTYSDFVTGRASLNPTPVSLYSAPQPCACPASGCGCGA